MKKLAHIIVYLCSTWFVASGILLMMGKLSMSDKTAGLVLICFGLCELLWMIHLRKVDK